MLQLFLEWYLFDIPKSIKKIWFNYVWFFARYFALADLGREFFSPWKGLTFSRQMRSFDLGDIASAAFGNLFSRFIGSFIRLFFLFFGLLAEAVVGFAGIVSFIVWICVVPAVLYSFFRGIYLLSVS